MNRTERLREKMVEQGLDAVLVFDELNQHYLSRFAFTDGMLVITAKRAVMITDFRYYEMAVNGAAKGYEILMPEKKVDEVTRILKDEGCKRVGFEGGSVSFFAYSELCRNYPFVEFVSIADTVEQLRQLKDEEEIAMMQKAQDITDRAFAETLSVLTPNMTEIEVAAELEYRMRKLGASGFAFDTIAVSGDASALPHGTPRNVKLKQGFLTMDFGAKYCGYCSDMTRTVVIGKADEEIKRLYNTVLAAQKAGLEAVRAGADCALCDKAARDIIDAVPEYRGAFGHSLGHAVGLFIHEKPGLSRIWSGRALRVGEIVTVEPGIYLFGKYGCRIEDMVAVRENGIYNFTHSPKELIEIM